MASENMDGKMIDAAVAAGAKGIVIAGVGNGNMTKSALDALGGRRRTASCACGRRASRRGRWAQRRGERRQPRHRRLARSQSAEGARAAPSRAAADAGPEDDPALFRRILR